VVSLIGWYPIRKVISGSIKRPEWDNELELSVEVNIVSNFGGEPERVWSQEAKFDRRRETDR